ncbi:Misato segment II tubulin-like domain-containing protein [Crepidotus variabilis]|uniref:Misato segment II tubulin-like domain-containing protein n=1 Tax=Crepidotus variabilis TaxID=179855 RepID=A0A9P6E6Z0_9AGAR|nr:Misato segment II tubulin-like domain-containing protein [Crepidotus variabilis]
MKEILYVQAGELSNYTGTHFWNTQECYMGTNEIESLNQINPSISFCENVNEEGTATLCPRALIFDRKAHFGSISSPGELGIHNNTRKNTHSTWNGAMVEVRHEEIPKSHYQTLLEEGVEATQSGESIGSMQKNIRFWSDYNRLYYLSRSLQRVPDAGATNLTWLEEQATFDLYDKETDVIDGSLRRLVEDCDNLQGLQLMNDTNDFGGFIRGFLACFRDEYLKLPSLTFPTISMGPRYISASTQDAEERALVNEALFLRDLSELSTMNIVIQEPSFWPTSDWERTLGWPGHSLYHQSALLSSIYETATLPLRQTSSGEDMSTICQLLKCQNATPYGELVGRLIPSQIFKKNEIMNLSSRHLAQVFSQLDVTRGFSSNSLQDYEKWSLLKNSAVAAPYIRSFHTTTYPLPTSFPSFPEAAVKFSPEQRSTTIRAVPVIASMSTSSNVALTLQNYAELVDQHIKSFGRLHPSSSMGLSSDELKDLADDLWRLNDGAQG